MPDVKLLPAAGRGCCGDSLRPARSEKPELTSSESGWYKQTTSTYHVNSCVSLRLLKAPTPLPKQLAELVGLSMFKHFFKPTFRPQNGGLQQSPQLKHPSDGPQGCPWAHSAASASRKWTGGRSPEPNQNASDPGSFKTKSDQNVYQNDPKLIYRYDIWYDTCWLEPLINWGAPSCWWIKQPVD